jgi:hypothetical protein
VYVGLVLVLVTAIPRNYDQLFFLGSPAWLIGPLVFSFFSGSFLFFFLYYAFFRRHLETPACVSATEQWRSFLALFWMTAPIAWLYAIPVERFFDSYGAAKANLSLLASVALWRVVLMARIISLLQEVRFFRALGWVLIPAAVEVMLVVFFGTLFSPSFGKRVMASMSGMRNAPEEDLLLSGLNAAGTGAFFVLIAVVILMAMIRCRHSVRPFPKPVTWSFPILSLSLVAGLWVIISLPAQKEQQHFAAHAGLIDQEKYREAIDFMARWGPDAFPPSRRIEPNPYEYSAFDRLPIVLSVLQLSDPEWIRQTYVGYLTPLFSHYWFRGDGLALLRIVEALERLPEGRRWITENPASVARLENAITESRGEEMVEALARAGELLQRLRSEAGAAEFVEK